MFLNSIRKQGSSDRLAFYDPSHGWAHKGALSRSTVIQLLIRFQTERNSRPTQHLNTLGKFIL